MNRVTHVTILLDASSSMYQHAHDVIKVTDTQISSLASRAKAEEIRVSVFSFSSPQYLDGLMAKNLIYDTDVLRVPSISNLYKPNGNTALCDAMIQVIADQQLIPEKYGDHAHLLYVITDGYENASREESKKKLPAVISLIPGNWTLAAFAPGQDSAGWLKNYGFPAGNISIWDPSQEHAARDVGVAMASATSSYLDSRSTGMRSTTNLFSMNAPSASSLKSALTPMTPGSYYFEQVTAQDLAIIERGRIDQFMANKLGHPYVPERTYYEFTKRERIQHYKQLAIAIWDKDTNSEDVYIGEAVRAKLGLPASSEKIEVRISPGNWNAKGYKVYVQTTSNNRKLVPGSRLLVMR